MITVGSLAALSLASLLPMWASAASQPGVSPSHHTTSASPNPAESRSREHPTDGSRRAPDGDRAHSRREPGEPRVRVVPATSESADPTPADSTDSPASLRSPTGGATPTLPGPQGEPRSLDIDSRGRAGMRSPSRPPAGEASPASESFGTQRLPRVATRYSIEVALAAALRQAEADAGPDARWVRRARRAAALPTFSVSYDVRSDQGWRHDSEPGQPDALVRDAGAAGVARVKATWELDRLFFNLDEVRASRAAVEHHDWRTALQIEVTRVYFQRRRLQLDIEAERGKPEIVVQLRVELLEAEAHLHVLTGLDWSSSP